MKKLGHCLLFMFPSWVMVLNFSRKVYCLQLCASFSKKSKSVETIYIFHLKVLTTLFQKMIWFIGVWATLCEILVTKILKNMLTQQKFNKISWFQTLISSKTVSHSIISNHHFLKMEKETFLYICNLF